MRWVAALLLLFAGWTGPAAAHLTPNSEVRLDFGRTRVAAEIVVPLGELADAMGVARPSAAAMRAYLARRIAVRAPDGRAWAVTIDDVAVMPDGIVPDMVAHLTLVPPPGAPVRVFDLHHAAVIDRVAGHFVLVVARADFAGGQVGARPRMIGGLQGQVRTLRVDRGPGSDARGFRSAVGLGVHHIAEGHDHLLFLVALLLPAPLVAAGRRWGGYGGMRRMARRLVAVVTAFTIGHSLTLIGGAFLGWQLPARPVEIGIALSILVSAIHAWRPLFAGREAWVAGGFGLVHGLAFATLIGHFGFDPWEKAVAILGFNIGIELVQLAVVACVVPALVLLAPTPAYRPLRLAGAGVAAVAAAAWLVERVSGADTASGRAIDAAFGWSPWVVAGLTVAAAIVRARAAGLSRDAISSRRW